MTEHPEPAGRWPGWCVFAAAAGPPGVLLTGTVAASTIEPLGTALGPVWGAVAAAALPLTAFTLYLLAVRAVVRRVSRRRAARTARRGHDGAAAEVLPLGRILGVLAGRGGGGCERNAAAAVAADLLPDSPVPAGPFLAAFEDGLRADGSGAFAVLEELSVLARWCGENERRAEAVFLAGCRVAAADGHVSDGELEVLEQINRGPCGGRFDPAEFAETMNANSPYAVLGLTPPCSREEVRAFGERQFKAVADARERIEHCFS